MTYIIKSKRYKTYYNKATYPLFACKNNKATKFLTKEEALACLEDLTKVMNDYNLDHNFSVIKLKQEEELKPGTIFLDLTGKKPDPNIIQSIYWDIDYLDESPQKQILFIESYSFKYGLHQWGCVEAFKTFLSENRVKIIWTM